METSGLHRASIVPLCVALAVALGLMGTPASAARRAPTAFSDWPTYHLDAARTGYAPGTPPIGTLSKTWTATLDGGVYAEPLVVGGRLIVATENDTVFALDPATGSVLWQRHVGTPVPRSQLPCGDIDPLGITGTPAFDPVSGRLFVAAERESPTNSVRHRLFALNPATGQILGSRSIDPAGSDPTVEQQRAALAVGNGGVYVTFGALAGDCGDYHGYVVGSATSLTGPLFVFAGQQYVAGARRGGIWATPGPSIDGSGNLFVAVGNGASTTTYDGSDSVIRLSPTLRATDFFAPSTWQSDNATDADLGSQSPALVPGGYVYAGGKSGTGYLLSASSLGHIGGQLASASVCASYGGTALVGSTLYVPCSDGIRAVDVAGGAIHVQWHVAQTAAKGPPVVGGGAVWSIGIANGTLYAFDPATGGLLTSIAVGAVEHFVTPTLSGGMAFVPTTTGVVGVSGA